MDESNRVPGERREDAARQQIISAFLEFLVAGSWAESRRLLERRRELLTAQADAELERLVPAMPDLEFRRILEYCRALFRRCGEVGIEAAFLEFPDPTADRAALPVEAAAGQWSALADASVDHLRRYAVAGDPRELERAIGASREALELIPPDLPHRAVPLSHLGNAHLLRYSRTGELLDLDEAIVSMRQAAEFTTSDSPYLARVQGSLGACLIARYERKGELSDLLEGIGAVREALDRAETESPDQPRLLLSLGNGLVLCYLRTGDMAELGEAIGAYRSALQLTTPESTDYAAYLNGLGNALLYLYDRSGDQSDLGQALQALRESIDRTPHQSPDLAGRLSNLGEGLRYSYERTGEPADLDGAIRASGQAIDRTPREDPDCPKRLVGLGLGLSARYRGNGSLSDLEEAILCFREAYDLTPPSSPELPNRLINLALGLRERFGRTGELRDIEEAVDACEKALELTPAASPDRPGRLSELGTCLTERHKRSHELSDLDAAISAFRQALSVNLRGSVYVAVDSSNLARCLLQRYAWTGEPPDLEEAIRLWRQAVDVAPQGSAVRAGVLANLGIGLRTRHTATGELSDLEEACAVLREAAELTPSESHGILPCLSNLGDVLADRHGRTGQSADLEQAIWAWERATAFLQTSYVAAPVAYKLGQQRQWMSLYARLVDAQLRLARASEPQAPTALRRAMEMAEGSKSRLLTALVGRGDVPLPSAIPVSEADRERELMNALAVLDAADLAAYDREGVSQEQATRVGHVNLRRERIAELEEMWRRWSQLGPAAADHVALRRGDPPAWKELSALARDLGPHSVLLCLFTTTDRTLVFVLRGAWDAPAVIEGAPDGVEWADLARRFEREMYRYDFSDRRGVTWDQLLRPLMEKVSRHLDGAQRMILAPQALGHFLPWAVVAWRAGLRASAGVSLPVVTLPALGLLPRLRRRPAVKGSEALVVGNPTGGLEYAEWEAREVADVLGTRPAIGRQATRETIRERLTNASIVHLATHAHFAPGSPLDSGIVLADGVLTAQEIVRQRLQADLVVLSACQTGMSVSLGGPGGEELAGLAQAFLHAGARSLLVTLWSVNDRATAALMLAFYSARESGADKAEALSQAMAEVRAQERWSHPYFWGPLVLMGNWE